MCNATSNVCYPPFQQEREHRLRMAEAEHRQRFMEKDRQRMMQYYVMDPREKEQRELETKRVADEERIRQARMIEEERRVHEQRFVFYTGRWSYCDSDINSLLTFNIA